MLTEPWWVEHRFPAMGSHVHVMLWGTDADAAWAEQEIARLEARWSRFLPCSDVARINRAAGRGDVAVTPETIELVVDACAWWAATDGWFDPTVLRALEANGYDAPFADVRARPATTPVVTSAPPGLPPMHIPAVGPVRALPAPGCDGIAVDRDAGVVALPADVGIDLGGIGKGAATDRVVAGLRARGIPAACVSMGGDIRAFGRDWAIPVLSPVDPARVLFTHMVDDGALVTSTDQIRRWVQDGRAHHHLIDPTTGRAAETGLTAVIVAADSTARAEVLAKAAFVAGPERGAELLMRHGVDGWFVDARGRHWSATRALALATS